MGILIGEKTKVIVQGITGRDGSFHARQMKEYGTKIVAGVTPGRGGEKLDGIPVFDSVKEARETTGTDCSVIYVPPAFATDAIYEAADAGVPLVVCITEGIPAADMLKVYHYLKTTQTRLIGPNCPGLITPGACKVGIMPASIHIPGPVGVVSRSGTLTYEVVYNLTLAGIGQSTAIGIGGDPIIGTDFVDVLALFEKDRETKAVVLIGEIGGTDEERSAAFIKAEMSKPVAAFIAGQTAPPGKRMGHAGAIISGGSGTAAEKIETFRKAGVPVASTPAEIPALVEKVLGKSERRKISFASPKLKKKAAAVKMDGFKGNHRKKTPALAAKEGRTVAHKNRRKK
ncbi:MAG: succinate--CoA ligase subunit alpha [candidate division Zixibacteria bacterium]|nr:succinate--CoA ligase subunit alpha [candidate division Zixibacteria bacterium]